MDAAPSKSQRKRDMHELQDIGEQLLELNDEQFAQMALPESLGDALLEARRLHHTRKHEAQRRQMQYIGKLMRETDTAPILEKLAAWRGASKRHAAQLHQIERWRERLLDERDTTVLSELATAYPTADLQHLRTLARNAQKEKIANKPPKNFRLLFQALRGLNPD